MWPGDESLEPQARSTLPRVGDYVVGESVISAGDSDRSLYVVDDDRPEALLDRDRRGHPRFGANVGSEIGGLSFLMGANTPRWFAR